MTKSNFTPLGDRVLVRSKTETEKKSKGGLKRNGIRNSAKFIKPNAPKQLS